MVKESRVNLTLLKRLVQELEQTAQESEKSETATNVNEYIVTLSKVCGLAAGVAHEATMLVMDAHAAIRSVQSPSPYGGEDMDAALEKLLRKGGGNTN